MNPILFAAGVAFVALPIILHFLRRRRPPVLWGAMRFLQEAYRRRRRRMTIEQLLLLACRCALVLALALLIGRPLFGGTPDASGPREVFLLVDNSIAAARQADAGTALDELKERASEVLDELDASAGDRAALIALAGPTEGVVFPPSGDIAGVRRLLMGLEARDSAADLPGAFALVGENDADAEPDGRSVVILSELRSGSVDTAASLPPIPASIGRVVVAEPTQAIASNIAVTSVASLRPVVVGSGRVGGQAAVTLERSGAPELSAETIPIELWIAGGARLASSEIVFDAGQREASALVWFELPESVADNRTTGELSAGSDGVVVLEARLASNTAGDTVSVDNVARRPIDRRRSLEVGVIARRSTGGSSGGSALERFDAADWVRLALAPQQGSRDISVVDVRPAGVDGPRLATLDAALVLSPDALDARGWASLRAFVDRGGLVVVTPPPSDDVQLWTDAFVQAFDLDWSIAREATESDDDAIAVDLPNGESSLLRMLAGELEAIAAGVGVTRRVAIDPMSGASRVELATESGEPFIVAGEPTPGERVGRGLVVYVASAFVPAWTDLPTRPLMVPLMQELVRQGVGRARGDASAIAGRVTASNVLNVVDATGAPTARPVRTAGVYTAAGDDARVLAVNPDTRGARLDVTERSQLAAWFEASLGEDRLAWLDDSGAIERAGGAAEPVDSGMLVLWLAALALALAVIETLLARAASRGSTIEELAAPAAGRAAA
ncbi:MAG: BatA domain-containing protein [Planctomycetota bacterium]